MALGHDEPLLRIGPKPVTPLSVVDAGQGFLIWVRCG